MFWAQALLCFGLWIGYGVALSRRAKGVREWARRVSASARGGFAGILFLLGAGLMFATLAAVAAGHGIDASGLKLWAWGVLLIGGFGFVHLQTLATALLVTSAQEAVTQARVAASGISEPLELDSNEAPSR